MSIKSGNFRKKKINGILKMERKIMEMEREKVRKR
jgi:hypothetical protein